MTHRTRLRIGTLLLILSLPLSVAARSLASIIPTSAPTVSRASFIGWSIDALSLVRSDDTCTLPYKRFPRGLKGTLCYAHAQGILDIFGPGTDYTLGQPITRGESLMILTILTDRSEDADVSGFNDVRTADEKKAAKNAVTLKWMTPDRANYFGLRRQLSGAEALSLLQAIQNETPSPANDITISVGSERTSTLPKEELMQAVWDLVHRDYLRKDKIDEEEASYKAIEGMVNSLNDPYTNFFRPVSASAFESQIRGDAVSGIGAQIEDQSGIITVVAPIPGSPAERAGIMTGDQILSADDHDLANIGVDKAVTFIRGERGTTVVLKIRRGGVEMTVSVVRDVISIPEIQLKWYGDIAVVQLVQFGETTLKQIRSVFADVDKKNPRGIILDLRNNGGGLLSAADVVASNFLPRGTVVAKVQSKTDTSQETTDSDPTIRPETKVVVLVNKGSASASEIVAGALQDWKRATIVGTQSFGKGTVQEVISFRTGEALKITVAEWLTPLGRKLDGVGVKPDVIIDSKDRDEQLQRALDILR
jgi:carboxyl-terminal processing protease